MRKTTMTILLGCLAAGPLAADVTPLDGFYYGSMPAPTGWEWQSPDSVAYNKLQAPVGLPVSYTHLTLPTA